MATEVSNEYTCMIRGFQNIPYWRFAILNKGTYNINLEQFSSQILPLKQDFVWK